MYGAKVTTCADSESVDSPHAANAMHVNRAHCLNLIEVSFVVTQWDCGKAL
jgi:hypothetical protein